LLYFNRLAVVLAIFILVLLSGCDKPPARSTPEGTIAATKWAVERGQASRIGEFIYADSPDMRRLMNRLGVFFGNVQKLGTAIQVKFPAEVAKMAAQAEEAAKAGKSSSLIAQMTSQMRGGGGRRGRGVPEPSNDMRDSFDNALKSIFADPYGWIKDSEKRLTTEFLTDDSVSLLWDEKPLFPPVTLAMKLDATDGKWYYMLPTNLPGVSGFMPKTKDQFEVFGGLIQVFDRVVIDLRKDVEGGKLRSLDEVSKAAGEKTFIPAAMTVFAYSRLIDSQKKKDVK